MAVLNYQQVEYVKGLIRERLEDPKGVQKEELEMLKGILEGLDKDEFEERTRRDVELLLEVMEDKDGNPIELTDEEKNNVIRRVMGGYDYSDYNQYIEDTIREEIWERNN